jgi:hypothetical protein
MTYSDDLYAAAFGGNDQIDPSESLTGDNTDDPLDAGYSPPERPSHSWRGDTAEEAREGESLDAHLSEEEPEVWDQVPTDVGRAEYASSAEEAAVHIVDEDEG